MGKGALCFLEPPRVREVWVALGDSEMAGKANPSTLPIGYPPSDGTLWMLRSNSTWQQLSEPCADGAYPPVGYAGAGLAGWKRQQARGGEVAVVNCAVGSTKSNEWMPGTAGYANIVQRARAAVAHPGCYLGGYILFDGANDAVDASPPYQSNWETTFQALDRDVGAGKKIITRLCPTVPTDMAYPSWSSVRSQQDALAAAAPDRTIVQAPDGPWIEAYKLHLDGDGNQALADIYLAAM